MARFVVARFLLTSTASGPLCNSRVSWQMQIVSHPTISESLSTEGKHFLSISCRFLTIGLTQILRTLFHLAT